MDIKVIIYDCETYLEFFLLKLYNPDRDKWYEFRVNRWINQVDSMIRFLENHKDYYLVGYNSLSFDAQILEWIYRNYESWHESSGIEIASKICQKAQDTIDNSNYEVFPEYREKNLSFKQIDIFRVNHWDNKNARVSLKRLAFEMDMELIEELPIPFNKVDLSKEEVEKVSEYCKNDCLVTYNGWLYTIGEVDHPLYKGNNQIQIRLDIQDKYGIPCLNNSNAKIGDEIIKKYYCESKGIEYSKLPKKGFFRKSIALKNCIPNTISFKTKHLQDFLKETKSKTLGIDEDFENSIKFYGQEYTFAKGGVHNVINGKVYQSDEKNDLVDIDVSGWYPAIIINNKYYPYHLGKEFLEGYSRVYYERIPLKPLAKKDNKIKGIVEALKQAGNCPYGKSMDMQSWLYDRQMGLATCLTGEFGLLMLIESCELQGIKCIMANTDGATFIIPKDKRDLFNVIKKDWLTSISRELTYEIEEVEYEKMIFSTVNDYLAIKKDKDAKDRVKLKGDFVKDFLLRMNKSKKVVAIALEKYYMDNIPVEKTIKEHTNIYDFCIRQKASKDFHYEGIKNSKSIDIPNSELLKLGWYETIDGTFQHLTDKRPLIEVIGQLKIEKLRNEPKSIYKKLIRYYISNSGERLFKIKEPHCTTNAAPISMLEKRDDGSQYLIKECNYLPKDTKISDMNLNYQYYIDKANKIIDKIKLEGRKSIKVIPNQMSLF